MAHKLWFGWAIMHWNISTDYSIDLIVNLPHPNNFISTSHVGLIISLQHFREFSRYNLQTKVKAISKSNCKTLFYPTITSNGVPFILLAYSIWKKFNRQQNYVAYKNSRSSECQMKTSLFGLEYFCNDPPYTRVRKVYRQHNFYRLYCI